MYNISQHCMRVALEEQNEKIPNQLGKQTSTLTLRWAFQLMEGVIVARELRQTDETRTTYFNLNALRVKTVRLFGPLACEIYGSTLIFAGMCVIALTDPFCAGFEIISLDGDG